MTENKLLKIAESHKTIRQTEWVTDDDWIEVSIRWAFRELSYQQCAAAVVAMKKGRGSVAHYISQGLREAVRRGLIVRSKKTGVEP